MSNKAIQITQFDFDRLKKLLWEAQSSTYRKSEYLKDLNTELNRAEIVQPWEIPADTITMNSTACLEDVETGEEEIYTLVFPENSDPKQGRISILAPIGTAMLGYKVGDTFEWKVPDGTRKLRIKKILFQPESTGNFDL